MPEETKPQSPSTALAPFSVFQLMERADDEMIIAEMQGAILSEYVYSFEVDGKKITGLSKPGVQAVVAELAKRGEAIRVLDYTVSEDTKNVSVIVKAGRFAIGKTGQEVLLDVTVQSKRQPKLITLRSGAKVEDPFYFEKAIAKGVRNAQRALIPETIATELIARYLEQGKTKRLRDEEEPRGQPARKIPPATQPASRAAQPQPSTPQSMTNDEFRAEVKEMGYLDGAAVLKDLDVPNFQTWKASGKTLRDAIDKLKAVKQTSAEITPEAEIII